MVHTNRTHLISLLLGIGVALPCYGDYRTFNDCKELNAFLKAVPNTCVLFIDGVTGNKKRMLRQLVSDYYDINVRFAVADASVPGMRRCAEALYIFQYPSFALFKGNDLTKIVRGNPTEDDLRYQLNKQLVRDPENWALYNNQAFHMCNWAERQQQLERALPRRQQSAMRGLEDVVGLVDDAQGQEIPYGVGAPAGAGGQPCPCMQSGGGSGCCGQGQQGGCCGGMGTQMPCGCGG